MPITENTAEEVKIPEAPKNYRQIRYASGVYGLYDTTFFAPEPQLKEEEKAKEIEERITYIRSSMVTENSGRELDKDKLSSKTLPINLPKDKKIVISTLEECLNAKETTNINFYRALCRISRDRLTGYGIIIGDNYIIAPASLIYQAALSKELKLDEKVEISVLEEIKEKGEGSIDHATVLALNPLADIALLEITDPKQKRNWHIPILNGKKIKEVTLYTDSTIISLESSAKLKESELFWRFTNKELKTAQALNFSLITIKTPLNLIGSGIYNTKGLIGVIAGRAEKDYDKESINTLVIKGDSIRNFLTDYINFLRSGSDNLETLTKFTKITPEETKTQIEKASTESNTESNKVITLNPTLLLLLASISIGASVIRSYIPIKDKKDQKEETTELTATEKIVKVPATIVENKSSKETMDGFEQMQIEIEDITNFKGHFINWLEESAKERLKLPKDLIEFYKMLNLPNKLLELQKEREKRLAPLEVERIERLIKLLDLDKI